MTQTVWYWAIIAQNKAGKTTIGDAATEVLGEVGLRAATINFSDAMGEALKALRHIPRKARPEYQKMSRGLRHEDAFGEDVWGREIEFRAREAAAAADLVVLAGMRRQEEFDIVRRLPRNHISYLTAPFEKRLAMHNAKAEREGGVVLTPEQFQLEEDDECEVHIREIGGHADSIIDNSGTLDDLQHRIRLLLRDRFGYPVRI